MHASANDPLIGRLIDRRYSVRSRIARGGMATVYEADDLRLDRSVAIKIMHAHLSDDEQFRERFIGEAKAAARLAHPNVVGVFDQGEDGEIAYLVMENLPSITLRDLLIERGAITAEQALDVLVAVLSGLSAAHKASIVHRDLKPENILLAHDGRIKIADFGLARAATANTATGKALLGTIAYLSPELLTRGTADARSDIYAVGIVLYEMLTGKQPFTGEQPMQIAYQHANNSVPLPSDLVSTVPRSLDALVQWATHRNPNLRPVDAGEMLDHVLEVQELGLDSPVHETKPLERPESERETTVLAFDDLPEQRPYRTPPSPPAAGATSTTRRQATSVVPNHERPRVATATLTRRTSFRRKTGWVWLILVMLLAAASASAGWWLNTGPGGATAIPAVEGESVEDARIDLEEQRFVVAGETKSEASESINEGLVVRSEPPQGTMLQAGETITLVVSTGLPLVEPPAVAGKSEEEASKEITEAGFSYSGAIKVFNDQDRGTALQATLADGTDVTTLETIRKQTPIVLFVSAGPLPQVEGDTQAEAEEKLKAAELGYTIETANHAEIPEGQVIAASLPEGIQPGGSGVTVTVSLGPVMVAVPNVDNLMLNEAIAKLKDEGFIVEVDTNVVQFLWNVAPVTGVDPESGTMLPEGSTVTVSSNL
ncbi:Stk1 family PASTA domain-containing Ser/Thr kinase [Humidisolicoccus flavus]|uniref:Stk1 family PASTA domain-containing Ser/Thr kinase n=1 Tax=Humidisolicoccus flavus TaxID=3111414 RepID=UPI00324B9DB7